MSFGNTRVVGHNSNVPVTSSDLGDGKRGLDVKSLDSSPSEDASNSTSAPLTNGSTFIGPWTQRTRPEILMAPQSDQNFTYYAQFATEQLSDSLPYTATLSSESDTTYEADITDNATWSTALVDGMTVTVTPTVIGNADAEIDRVYVEVVSSTSVIPVSYVWFGDEP